MKRVFIVNPTSCKGRAKQVGKKLERICQREFIDYEIHYTTKPKEATEIAKRYKRGKHIIYSVGGDGTLNEVINGMVGTKNLLGVIPAGSGNDFYRTIKDRKEREFPIDVGKINDRYFINVASIGIDSEVGANADMLKKKHIPASQIYNVSIIYTLLRYQLKKISFNLNKTKKEGKYTLVAICNSRYYGGGYPIAPIASLDDGLFDIYFVDPIEKYELPRLLLKLKKGKHGESPNVHMRQADKISIHTEKPIIFGVDGETIYGTKFELKIKRHALTVYHDRDFEALVSN